MNEARCSCGNLSLEIARPPQMVVACHCTECQRRTGSPFGAGAFYPSNEVKVTGTAKEFTRDGLSGGKVQSYFCPDCGSTVYWKADRAPGFIAVAVGCVADSGHPHPARSIWEQTKHAWVQVDADQHRLQGST